MCWIFAMILGPLSGWAQEKPTIPDKKIREIFVPFEDLDVMLEGRDQRVFLTRQEYEQLLAKARLVPADEKAPRTRVFLSADYEMTIHDGRATIDATLALDVLTDELLGISLSLGGVSLRSATMDAQPAALGRAENGAPIVFVRGRGRHELKLNMMAPLETTAAQQLLRFQLVTPTATRWRLTVPGNVELKSGAAVVSRAVDETAGVTRFELLPQRAPTTLAMSLNNRILMQERVVLARSVLLAELTTSYERIHATVSLAIPHGAVDRFRFALPAGFEVMDVTTPNLARWSVEKREAEDRVLDITLRESTTETVVIRIVAANNAPKISEWKLAQIRPLDVANHVSVVGVLTEERLNVESLTASRLIPIDVTVLSAAIPASVLQAEPGVARVKPVAAYYAPQPDFDLVGVFRHTPAKLDVTSNLLFTISDAQLQVRAGFALLPKAEKLFAVNIQIPATWQVTEVTQNDGTKLPYEIFPGDTGGIRLQVRLPQGAPPGSFFNLFVHARTVPAGWLNEWSQTSVAFPVMTVLGADRDVGAVAIQAQDDLVARPDQFNGLTPLDEKEKAEFGMAGTTTSLAYRYDAQPYSARLSIERETPRMTARTFSFLRIEPEGVVAHYELIYQVERARARRLTLRLPANTPATVSIRGLDVPVKEYRSEEVPGQGPLAERRWIAELSEPRSGTLRLAIDFQQSLPTAEPKDFALPIVRADGVDYQSGTVAVEGSAEFDVQVKTSARPVDVGELVDAQYQVGKRLLGAFGFVGDSGPVLADISQRPEFGLPAAIVQRAELVTLLSAHGRSQTAARYQLKTKAQFLELRLPPGAELWSATVDNRPASPQREQERLLISLPLGSPDTVRDLNLVYETPVTKVDLFANVRAAAPQLLLRDEAGKVSREVPMADLLWRVVLPEGYQLIRSGGTVFADDLALPASPVTVLGKKLGFFDLFLSSRSQRAPSSEYSVNEGMAMDRPAGGFRAGAVTSDDMTSTPALSPGATMSDGSVSSVVPMPEAKPVEASRPRQLNDRTLEEAEISGGRKSRSGTELFGDVPDAANKPQSAGTDKFWALQGVRSLPIELVSSGRDVSFRSMGVAPRLNVTLVSENRLRFLSAAFVVIVLALGVAKTKQRAAHKARFVMLVMIVALAAPPLIGLVTDLELSAVIHPMFYAAIGLILWYLVAGLAFGFARAVSHSYSPRRVASVTSVPLFILWLACWPSWATAQQPAAKSPTPTTAPIAERRLLDLLTPPQPVKLPADAIIVPYNPADPEGPKNATKVLVPYAEYVSLWNRAFPDKPLNVNKPAAPYGIAGATYSVTLAGEDFLTLTGRMLIESFIDEPISIPLPLEGGVLTSITLDGKAARVQVVQPQPATANPSPAQRAAAAPAPPAAALILLQVAGKGRKSLELHVRFKIARAGGWRTVAGRVPAASATAWDVTAPQAHTEIRLGAAAGLPSSTENTGGQAPSATPPVGQVTPGTPPSIPMHPQATIESKADNETIHAAIPPNGAFHLQWRPKVAESQVDNSLTARSLAVLDIQEDGLRLAWQVTMELGRGIHDSFSLTAPREFLVERVLGSNVRGWKTSTEQDRQTIDVTLLKGVAGQESLTLILSRRATVGVGEMAAFPAPVVTIRDAALHQGIFVVRRSPLLDVRVGEVNGLSRADSDGQSLSGVLAAMTEESPLGIRPFQTYRFVATPFTLRLAVSPYVAQAKVEVQALLKLAEREHRYEARVNFSVENRPRYTAQCVLPVGLKLDSVEGPAGLEWNVKSSESADELLILLPSGQREFSLVIRGRFRKSDGEVFAAPRLEVRDVAEQTGYVVVQADPAYDIRAEALRGCESVLLERVFQWVQEDQRPLARIALFYSNPDYAATLRMVPRQPRVNVFTITNVRITPFAIEDTIYLQFGIQDAGIRQVVFSLPAAMRDARITVPLLRQKTIEPLPENPAYVRVRLELQDEITHQLIVLVEHDRPLTGGTFDAPIPVVENARTDQRFLVLESAGRDEAQVTAAEELVELNRQQSQWSKITATLGDKITQAYLVRDDAVNPRLALATRQRAAVETAGARIGLAKTLLVVDGYGAYRAIQEYHVDNKTEQFLEVELPEGAALWTAKVAGETVKPTAVTGPANSRRVRVPLIKTSAGDLDYAVELKYGGWLRLRGTLGKVEFPLMHTVKIQVEQSQVRLRLPPTHHWFDFGGTMRRVNDEGDLLAGYFSYKSKQVESLLGVVNSSSDQFSKVRASNNLKQLGQTLETYRDAYGTYNNNTYFQRELSNNTSLLRQAEQVVTQQNQQADPAAASDNRSVLSLLCASQDLSRSKNVVTQLHENFDARGKGVASGEMKEKASVSEFNLKWFDENRLNVPLNPSDRNREQKAMERLEEKSDHLEAMPAKGSVVDAEGRAAANELGKKLSEESREKDAAKQEPESGAAQSRRFSRRGAELDQQVERYQLRLEQSQVGQGLNAPAQSSPAGTAGVPTNQAPAMGFNVQNPSLPEFHSLSAQPDASAAAAANFGNQQAAGTAVPALAGVRSLNIEIPQRGNEYLFFTTRGDIAIDARLMETRQAARWVHLGAVIAGLLVLAGAYRFTRRFAPQVSPAL